MKILTAVIKTLLFLFIVLILSALATFFLYVFLPENVQNAIEYFLQIFNFSSVKPLTNAFFGCII